MASTRFIGGAITHRPVPGEGTSRTAERAFQAYLNRIPGYSTVLFEHGVHGGDLLTYEPSARLSLVEIRSVVTSIPCPAPAPVFDVVKGLRVHRRTMAREGAERIVMVYAAVDTRTWTFTFRAMGGELFEALARRNSDAYLAEGGPRGRRRPPRYPVMFEEMDPLAEWFEGLADGEAA